MNELSATQTNLRALPKPIIKAGLIFLLVALVAGGVYAGLRLWQERQAAQSESQIAAKQAAAQAAIADKWGIQITQIAVVADGGLVDLRYQVFDPDKAIFLYDDLVNIPKIIAADGTEIALTSDPHRHDLSGGQTYFIIFRNVLGVITPGSEVTVVVGDLHIENFKVVQ